MTTYRLYYSFNYDEYSEHYECLDSPTPYRMFRLQPHQVVTNAKINGWWGHGMVNLKAASFN